jgi:hypothetical protein
MLGEHLELCSDQQIGDLLSAVQDNLELFGPDFAVCEHAKRRLLKSSARIPDRDWRVIRDAGIELLNAEAALYRAGIPHMLPPFQRDRFLSNMFLVPQVIKREHVCFVPVSKAIRNLTQCCWTLRQIDRFGSLKWNAVSGRRHDHSNIAKIERRFAGRRKASRFQ